MKQYYALWHEKWQKGSKSDEIIGYWPEDFSEYKIIVPSQLRDMLISLQHHLYDDNELNITKGNNNGS